MRTVTGAVWAQAEEITEKRKKSPGTVPKAFLPPRRQDAKKDSFLKNEKDLEFFPNGQACCFAFELKKFLASWRLGGEKVLSNLFISAAFAG